jgi:uracil-DNA glycosylase family 4
MSELEPGDVAPMGTSRLAFLHEVIVACTRCPRLVEHRRRVAERRPRRFREWAYWARPLPGFGDPQARLLVLGLAPAAHGGNRTGRVFTGDRSGDWLFAALHRSGFANQPYSLHRDDGLTLRDAYIAASVRCVPPENRPLPEELANCRPFLAAELALLPRVQVVIALGHTAFETYLALCREAGLPLPSPRPRFAHGARYSMPNGVTLIASYHPSQRNTQTGLLTRAMFDEVFQVARKSLGVILS